MDTKSKSTNLFKGMVSWLCLLLLLCCSATAVVGLIVLAVFLTQTQMYENILSFFEIMQGFPDDRSLGILYHGIIPTGIGLLLLIAAFVMVFLFRPDRKELESRIAGVLGKVWVEIKLLAMFLLVLFFCVIGPYRYNAFLFFTIVSCLLLLALYFLCLDIGHNRRFFGHNILHSILVKVNDYQNLPTFEQRSLRRVYSCLGAILGILLLSCLVMALMNDALFYSPILLLLFGATVVVGVGGVISWYIVSLRQDLQDWNLLMLQINEMYGGHLDAVNYVPPTSNLYHCALQLNSIRTGIQKAVDEGVKADRTKVELITNVSHDLKTPLTSIISYAELLKKEPDLPPHVMDYVNTISSKADRLSYIVQDVFEVSKAATGNISLDLKELDFGKLLQQTLAEMEETLESSGLTWRVDIPETPIMVYTDGQRMYRVFQNLIRNCAQYSLEGSRVYIQLLIQNGMAQVGIRNISKNEVTMNGDDLTARFVRGDENRTTEGSGLGLSIAKSFTEACGGQFGIHTDGDLFYVTVSFPLVNH